VPQLFSLWITLYVRSPGLRPARCRLLSWFEQIFMFLFKFLDNVWVGHCETRDDTADSIHKPSRRRANWGCGRNDWPGSRGGDAGLWVPRALDTCVNSDCPRNRIQTT
jgi:hypothetical protein